MSTGLFQRFEGVFILDGVRTPMVDYMGAFADANPIDLGIAAARAVLQRSQVSPADIDSVLAGNMAPGGFDQFYVPRHIGLYAGVPVHVSALMVQRICGTGFELFRQAAEQMATGGASAALVVGTESMTRNPIAAFDHRGGFRLGAPVAFKDYMWEALNDPAAVSMIMTAENLAKQYGISRSEVDAFAAQSFARALAAQDSGRQALADDLDKRLQAAKRATNHGMYAAQAQRIGLVSRLCEASALHDQTAALAAKMAAKPPLAMQLAKEAVRQGHDMNLANGIRLEADLQTHLLSTQDRLEAVAAFREKRAPKFTGQ